MRKIGRVLALVAGLGAAYVLLWPVPIDPKPWTPPQAPAMTGVLAPNDDLAAVERLEAPPGQGPEAVTFDGEGRIYSGLEDGSLVRWQADGTRPEVFARTGGRPIGMKFDGEGSLIVADADRGLLSVSPQGEVKVLATEHDGRPFRLTDDLDIAADGTIYFSDASHKFGIAEFHLDALEHGANGRLLAYDPASGETRLLLDGLHFANGVAVSPGQDYVLVAETTAFRIRRYWLAGERAGQSDFFAENLPGYPDNLTATPDGRYWVALPSVRNPDYERLLPRPWLRKVMVRLQRPMPLALPMVVEMDGEGRILRSLQAAGPGRYAVITSAVEREGYLYLGSIAEPTVGRLALRPRP
jgi:sugar lactone lactonase YvrE